MNKTKTRVAILMAVTLMVVMACSAPSVFVKEAASVVSPKLNQAIQVVGQTQVDQTNKALPAGPVAQATQSAQPQTPAASNSAPSGQSGTNSALLSAFEGTLEDIYNRVNPSVVNIRVVSQSSADTSQTLPFPGHPQIPNNPGQQFSQALGSGFVYDSDGHIVTNNHVVDGASKVEVTFFDGTTVPAKVIGTDPSSDLAVIQVDKNSFNLQPVTLADSTQVKVGQVAIAIGNPFGLQNTMTVGFISALSRSLPVNETRTGPSYTIPDIIQTDASINPGNSGGVLLDDQGQVIGVTSAIESPVRANSGVGFVIPSALVQRVIPALIKTGKYAHPWLGISGATLTPSLATAMNLKATQRGALVDSLVSGGPAEKAGLRASNTQTTIDGQQVTVGGDVITMVDGQAITSMDELIAYIADHGSVGQQVKLTVLRDGKETEINLTLGSRPADASSIATSIPSPRNNTPRNNGNGNNNNGNNNATPSAPNAGTAWLGVSIIGVTPDIASAMNLSSDQQGVLIESVASNGPADKAGLTAGDQTTSINGQDVVIGGDIITSINGTAVATAADLRAVIQKAKPGDVVTLKVLRNGNETTIKVTLESNPNPAP